MQRSLRFWAVCEVLYGLALGFVFVVLVPWKSAWINALFVAYAALHLASGHGLWRTRKWGWRLSVASGLVGFLLLLVLIGGFLGSFVYLKGVFGEFGFGASIAALLFASVALQVVGLYPALKLRTLLRSEIREHFGGGSLRSLLIGMALLPLVMTAGVHLRYSMSLEAPLSAEARAEASNYIRARLAGENLELPLLEQVDAEGLPIYLSLHGPRTRKGKRRNRLNARIRAEGRSLAEALGRGMDALLSHKRVRGRGDLSGSLQLDRIVGRAPIPFDIPAVVAVSVNPGLDGFRRVDGETSKTLLPADLIRHQRFGRKPLVPGIRELRFGADGRWVLDRLGLQAARLERFRSETLLTPINGEGAAQTVLRGNTPFPPGPEGWKTTATAGGDFILRQLKPDGRFHYQYFPYSNRHTRGGAYSLPRHSGTVYALALLYGETGAERFKKGAEKAIAWLDKKMPSRCGDIEGASCVGKKKADLGSTALTLVGMLEYQRRTKDSRYAGIARKLLRYVLHLQQPSGDFWHVYDLKKKAIDRSHRLMFFSEEAALALVMAHEVLGDAEYLAAAERALNFLTGPKYEGFFLGRFIYGADHWTCIAAEEAWPRLKHPQYLDFCEGYAAFIRRLQYQPGEFSAADFVGHYGFSGFMVPQAAAAGFTEAVISTHDLARHHGTPSAALEQQVALALDALAREQVRPDNAWLMPAPEAAYGGIRRSLVEGEIRIDFTQHAASALIRGWKSSQGS